MWCQNPEYWVSFPYLMVCYNLQTLFKNSCILIFFLPDGLLFFSFALQQLECHNFNKDTAPFYLISHHQFWLYKRKVIKRDFLAHLDSCDLFFSQIFFFFLFKGMTHHFDPYWLFPVNPRVFHSLWKEVKYFTLIIHKSIGLQIPT